MTDVKIDQEVLTRVAAKASLDRLNRVRMNLIKNAPLWGALAMRLDFKEAGKDVLGESPIAVDGKTIYYDPMAVARLKDADASDAVARATAYSAALLPYRIGKRDAKKWVAAGQRAIDPILSESGIELKNPLIEKQWKAQTGWMATETIYHHLPDPPPEPQGGDGHGDGKGKPPLCGILPFAGEGKKPGQGDGGASEQEMSGEIAEWRKAMAEAQQTAKSRQDMRKGRQAGTELGMPQSFIDQIMQPKVKWQEILINFVQRTIEDYEWMKPNRKFMPDVYLPGLHSENLLKLYLAVDTSGSVSDENLAQMMNEMREMLRLYPSAVLTVLLHTTEVYRTLEFSADNPPKIVDPIRGGTDFRPIFSHLEKNDITPDALICLTDLEGPAPTKAPAYPVLWVSCGMPETKEPWGERVMMED